MKKIVLSLSIAALIYGCEKESLIPVKSKSKTATTTSKSDEMSEIEKKIISFKGFMEKEDLLAESKQMSMYADSNLTVEDAVWNLEAEANYTNRIGGTQYNQLHTDTLIFTLPTTDGNISIPNITSAYREIKNRITEITQTKAVRQKVLVAADVSITNTAPNQVTLKVVANFGFKVVFSSFYNLGIGHTMQVFVIHMSKLH